MSFESAYENYRRQWQERWNLWLNYGSCWWGEGVPVSPKMRGIYESFLPWNEWRNSLRMMAETFSLERECPQLADEEAAPYILRKSCYGCDGNGFCGVMLPGYLSLPDFWAAMPTWIQGRVIFEKKEIFPLLCAMADPPRYGCICGRYSEQMENLRMALAEIPKEGEPLRILDVGCGVGLNTLEIAQVFAEGLRGRRMVEIRGITLEPLEVWMAHTQQLPHDSRRTKQFAPFADWKLGKIHQGVQVIFQLGDALEFPEGRFHMIFCNGLLGGPLFHQAGKLRKFQEQLSLHLVRGGLFWNSDHFHEGYSQNWKEML